MSFCCGGSRHFARFIHLFDGVFVLDVDIDTLNRRLASRTDNAWGKRPVERALLARLHATKEDIPKTGVVIDATPPIAQVVDEILRQCRQAPASPFSWQDFLSGKAETGARGVD